MSQDLKTSYFEPGQFILHNFVSLHGTPNWNLIFLRNLVFDDESQKKGKGVHAPPPYRAKTRKKIKSVHPYAFSRPEATKKIEKS